ncbi:SDR family oxidoreductase [Paucibacter sp. PLA-PC-4]|uniref:SDR family oxidoreductase n=1 Tax=Paucibacter sp. PLA-PC-4 TaxID=2993655 RepID=UPI002248770B|nr:SDR family oxidoreductase [Paucibacter sp. PLA-PC-4]MCX2860686.1 SDR family oxidoreductase [Paucibacter sp. PLA-PC-4]
MSETKKLQDRVAIVTGAGSGFGEGIAKLFAELGAKVVVADWRFDAAEKVAGDIEAAGGQAFPVHADVTKNESVAAMVAATVEQYGRVDILINNAGTTHKNQPMLEVDEATFDRVYATNVKSIYLGAIHTVPLFKKQRSGVIINIASTAGLRPRPGLSWYSGTKGAAITLTKGMAIELAPEGIRVCAINPVMGATGLIQDFLPGDDSEATRAKIVATIPMGRLSTPLDIAKATAFLASDDAEFITGVALEVDGGRCI